MRNFFTRAYNNEHTRHWVGILTLLAMSVASVNSVQFSSYLQGSVLNTPDHDPFDGTVMPFDKVPDWSRLSGGEYKYTYSEMLEKIPNKLVSMPLYDNDLMTASADGLGWSKSSDLALRTFKILYPVGYLDDYDYANNSGDYSGGHDGLDIKVPEGTPIRAVANGVVVESGYSSGNGNHIVVKTEDAPDPNNSNRTRTLYMSYSHNSQNLVAEGEVVSKGQIIGKVGATGTATTNHLHLQLDDEEAPFTPYWPFTSQDAANAGVNFWEGVDIGLGKDNVLRYSHHPLDWVQDHLNENSSSTRNNTKPDRKPEPEQTPAPSQTVKPAVSIEKIEIDAPGSVLTGSNSRIEFELLDEDGNTVEEPDFESIELSLSDGSLGRLSQSDLSTEDFKDGRASVKLYAEQTGEVYLTSELDGEEFSSKNIEITKETKPFSHFEIQVEGDFAVGNPKTVQILAVDEDGDVTSDFRGDGTVEVKVDQGAGLISPNRLSKDDFENGIAEVEVISMTERPLSLEVIYGNLKKTSEALHSQLFTDVEDTHPYFTAVTYLNKNGVFSGYPDGTARLDQPISRVEVLKLIFMGTEKEVVEGLDVKFSDTSKHQWYSPFLGTAYQDGIVEGYADGTFKPTQGVNRSEFLKMLLVTAGRSEKMSVSVDPVVTENPYGDVDRLAWFAPYVNYTKVYNLFPGTDGDFEPGKAMTRGEVAEVLYRLSTSQQNDGAPYSVLLDTK